MSDDDVLQSRDFAERVFSLVRIAEGAEARARLLDSLSKARANAKLARRVFGVPKTGLVVDSGQDHTGLGTNVLIWENLIAPLYFAEISEDRTIIFGRPVTPYQALVQVGSIFSAQHDHRFAALGGYDLDAPGLARVQPPAAGTFVLEFEAFADQSLDIFLNRLPVKDHAGAIVVTRRNGSEDVIAGTEVDAHGHLKFDSLQLVVMKGRRDGRVLVLIMGLHGPGTSYGLSLLLEDRRALNELLRATQGKSFEAIVAVPKITVDEELKVFTGHGPVAILAVNPLTVTDEARVNEMFYPGDHLSRRYTSDHLQRLLQFSRRLT